MKEQAIQAEKSNILGVEFNLVSYEDVLSTIDKWRRSGKKSYITLTPAISVMLCNRDKKLHCATANAGLTLPDSIGIILAAKLLGYGTCGRVSGPTLMLKCCDWGRSYGYRHYFYGGAESIADRLAEELSTIYPGLQIAGTFSPPFHQLSQSEDLRIVEIINATKPDVVWVGLGTPKQEKWMADHIGRIKATAMIGVGAAFDFHAGNVRWAPVWVRKIGMEWFYRLILEPKRWRRFIDIPRFIFSVIRQRLKKIIHFEATNT